MASELLFSQVEVIMTTLDHFIYYCKIAIVCVTLPIRRKSLVRMREGGG